MFKKDTTNILITKIQHGITNCLNTSNLKCVALYS